MHTNEYYIDFYIDGEVVLEELGEIIREVVDPSFSVTNLSRKTNSPCGMVDHPCRCRGNGSGNVPMAPGNLGLLPRLR